MSALSLFSIMSIVVSRNVDTPEFDDGLGALQRLLGVETGDLAGVVFSNPEPWNQASARERWSILLDYIRQEVEAAAPEAEA